MPPRGRTRGTPPARTVVRTARSARDVEAARGLFREYQNWLAQNRLGTKFARTIRKVDLKWIDEEIASLPGAYGPPGGDLILAFWGPTAVGCGALRRLGPAVGEVKRMYVSPRFRGLGLGRRLGLAVLRHARTIGYDRVVLDTLPAMVDAIALYRQLGFAPIPPYWDHPVPNALFFEISLPRTGRPRRPARPVRRSDRRTVRPPSDH